MSLREDGFVHLHCHSSFSNLDGISTPEDIAARAKEIGQEYVCITDHGVMSAIPRQIKACDKVGLNALFGIELYQNPLQIEFKSDEDRKQYVASLSESDRQRYRKNFHILAIAYNETGYKNLVRLSSWGWLSGYGGNPARPRVNYEQLLAHKEGIIFTSCCYAGEIGYTFDTLGEDAAMDKVEQFMVMFGEDFRLEIMMLDFAKQRPYDKFIIKAHEKYHIPIFISQDCHVPTEGDSKYQQYMLMIRTKRTIHDIARLKAEGVEDLFELQDQQLWIKSEQELNTFWDTKYSDIISKDIFEASKQETVNIARKAKGIQLDRSNKLPKIPDDQEKLKEKILAGVRWRNLPRTAEYTKRLVEEYDLICRKDFASYFLIQKMMTDEARRICPLLLGYGDGNEAVGCGRGSSVGSLVCYCLGITDIDPLKHGLLFSRFLSEARGGKTMNLTFTNIDPVLLKDLED